MCENCNENNYQQVHICSEEQVPCSCPVKDLSTDCVNFDQEDLKYDATTVVPKNTLLTVALDNILQFLKVKIEEIQNYFKVVNTGLGAKIYSGNTLLGEKKLRSLTSSDNSVDIVETANEIDITVQAIVPDGSETKLQNGTNTTVSGNGTVSTPYQVNVNIDGSETKISNGTNTTISGNGTTTTPYAVNVTFPTIDGSETKLSQGTNITITGNGTAATPYIINASGIAPVDNRVFEKIDEGNGLGIIIKDRNSLNYGNVGLGAIDLGFSNVTSTSNGALGSYSSIGGGIRNSAMDDYTTVGGGLDNKATQFGAVVSGGQTNTASGQDSVVTGGRDNIAEGSYSTVTGGRDNKALSFYSNVSGQGNEAKSQWEWVGGAYGTAPEKIGISTWEGLDRIFNIGNGTGSGNLSDAFTILKNGLATLPSVTNALIEAASDKAIVTKEYLSRQRVITASTTLSNTDNDQTIFIDNGVTPIIITINTTVTTANFGVGFIQEGTGDVTFVGTGVSLTNPIGLKSKGQGYATYIERKLNTSAYFLLGDTKN